ncbi:Rho GTPase-activating protein 35 [Sparganum proliferum]
MIFFHVSHKCRRSVGRLSCQTAASSANPILFAISNYLIIQNKLSMVLLTSAFGCRRTAPEVNSHIMASTQQEIPDNRNSVSYPGIKFWLANFLMLVKNLVFLNHLVGLGHEQRYGKEYLPDRELEITGFLLLFDVSQRFHPDARDLAGGCTQDQFSFFAEILSVLLKRKKPLVLVATKRDNVDEQVLQEFHQMLQKSSDFKRVPLIEVSSHCNINVELAFGTIVRLADNKTRFCKIRPLSYQEASRERDEEYRIAKEAYVNHVLRCPSEFLKNWQSFMSRYSHQVDVTRFVNLAGSTVAQNTFEQFSELQKTETKRRHMANLPNALRALLPHVGPVTNQLPEVILQRLRTHPAFDSYFLNDDALSDSGSGPQNAINQEQVLDGRCVRIGRQDNRIPFSLALKGERPDKLCAFLECFSDLASMERRSARMCAFESVLYEWQLVATHLATKALDTTTPCQPILPGQTFEDFRAQFSAFHNMTDLSLEDQCAVFMRFQEILRINAREEFLDLLLDNYSLFIHGVSSYIDRLEESSNARANNLELCGSFDPSRRTCVSDQDNSLSPNRPSSTSGVTESRRLLRIQTCDAQLLTAPPPKGVKEEQLALISAKICNDPRYKCMDYLPSERQTYLTNCFDLLLHDSVERILAPPQLSQTSRLSWASDKQDNSLSLGHPAYTHFSQNANFLPPSSSASLQPLLSPQPLRFPLLVCPSHSSGRCMDTLFAGYCRLAAGCQAAPASEHGREARVLSNRLSRFIGQNEELLSVAVCCVCADVLAAAAAINLLQCAGFLPEDLASSNSLDSPVSSGRLSSQRLFSSWPLSSTLLAEASLSVGTSSPVVDAVQATLLSHHELVHNILCEGNARKRTSNAVYDGVIFILSSDWCPSDCCSCFQSPELSSVTLANISARCAFNDDSPRRPGSATTTDTLPCSKLASCSCCELVFNDGIRGNGVHYTTNTNSLPSTPRQPCCCGLCHASAASNSPGFRQRSLVSRVACVSSILRLLGPIPSLILNSNVPLQHTSGCDKWTPQLPTLVTDADTIPRFLDFLAISSRDSHSPQTPIARCEGDGNKFCPPRNTPTPSLLPASNEFTFATARPDQYKINEVTEGDEEKCSGTGREFALDTLAEFLEFCWTTKRDNEVKHRPVCTHHPHLKTNRESCLQGDRSNSRPGSAGRSELRSPLESSPGRAKTTPSSSGSTGRLLPQRRCRHRYHQHHNHHHHHHHHHHRRHNRSRQPSNRAVRTADGSLATPSRCHSTVRESGWVPVNADNAARSSPQTQMLLTPSDTNTDLVPSVPSSSGLKAIVTTTIVEPDPKTTESAVVITSSTMENSFTSASSSPLRPEKQSETLRPIVDVCGVSDILKAVLDSSNRNQRVNRFRSISADSSVRRVSAKTTDSSAKTQSNSVSTVCGHDPIRKSDSEPDLPKRLLSVSAGNCNSAASSSPSPAAAAVEAVSTGFLIPAYPRFSNTAPETHAPLPSTAAPDVLPAYNGGDTLQKLDRYVAPPPPVAQKHIHVLSSSSHHCDLTDSDLEDLFDSEQDSLAAGHVELLFCGHTGVQMPHVTVTSTKNKIEMMNVSNVTDVLTPCTPTTSVCSTVSSNATTFVPTASSSSTSSVSFLGSGMVSGIRAAYVAVGGLARPRERRRSVSTPGGGDSLVSVGAGAVSSSSAAAAGSKRKAVSENTSTSQFLRGSAPLTLKSTAERSQSSASPSVPVTAAEEESSSVAVADSVATGRLRLTTKLVPNAECIHLVVTSLASLLNIASRTRQTVCLPHYHHWHHPSCAHRLCIDGPLKGMSNTDGLETVNKSGQSGVPFCSSAPALYRSVNFGNPECGLRRDTTTGLVCSADFVSVSLEPASPHQTMAMSPPLLSVADRKMPNTISHSHQTSCLSHSWFCGGGGVSALSGAAASPPTVADVRLPVSTDIFASDIDGQSCSGRAERALQSSIYSSTLHSPPSPAGSLDSGSANTVTGAAHVTKETTRWNKKNMKLSLFGGRHHISDAPGVPTGTRTVSVPSTPVRETVLQATLSPLLQTAFARNNEKRSLLTPPPNPYHLPPIDPSQMPQGIHSIAVCAYTSTSWWNTTFRVDQTADHLTSGPIDLTSDVHK